VEVPRLASGFGKLRPVRIAKDGTVSDVIVLHGSSPLAESAKEAVEQWRYSPFLKDGKPSEVKTTVTFDFADEQSLAAGHR